MFNPGDIIDGRYEIKAKVGQGGMSYVYRASDLKMGREVAVKVLKEEFSSDAEFVQKFNNEARSAARLSHPNIVAAYDTVDRDDLHYIVMELVEGITLKNYIARKGKLSNKETIGIAIQAAEGIAEAHRKGIIHRDIKPQNIIISRDGKVKVADFGIAKAASGDSGSQAVIGSAHYIAPEQARTGEADASSDLYSLGISMYEMITGKLPYEGENTVDIVMAHIQNVMVPPAVYNHDIYPALSDIITRATRKLPGDRYQTAEEMIEDLKHAAQEPEGRFVKLYDSVGSGSLGTAGETPASAAAEKNADPEEVKTGLSETRTREQETGMTDAAPEQAKASDRDLTRTETEENESRQEPGFSLMHVFENRLILAGFTLAMIAVIALAGVIAGKTIVGRQKATQAASAAETADISETGAAESTSAEGETETADEMDYTLSIQGEQLLPDLSGLSVNEARAQLAVLQISMDSSNTAYSDDFPEGTVISQSPVAGEVAAEEMTVFVTVSLGPEANHVLSTLKNLTIEDAAQSLQRVGIGVSASPRMEFSEDVAENCVIGYEELPANETQETMAPSGDAAGAGTEVKRVIRLIVSRGKAGDFIVMPQLAGLDQQTAENLIEASGLIIGGRTAINHPEAAPGTVVVQSAQAGEFIKKGTPVIIQISVPESAGIVDGTVLPPAAAGGTAETEAGVENYISGDFYYGSIDNVCTIGAGAEGPGGGQEVMVAVRLVQRIDESAEYTMIDEPRPVSMGSRIPVTYHNIQGAYGIDEGEVQVYNVNTGEVYGSYIIEFYPGE